MVAKKITEFTEDELHDIIAQAENELKARKRQAKAKLVRDFEKAFYALKEAGISVTYADCDDELEVSLHQYDCFNFYD